MLAALVLAALALTSCGDNQPPCSTHLETDNQNCGLCGRSCAPFLACRAGRCECPQGQFQCSDHCVDLDTDFTNCSACGLHCGAGQTCMNGACRDGMTTCPTGQLNCAAAGMPMACFNTMTDAAHCGSTCTACPAGQTCMGGTCTGGTTMCPTGQTNCAAAGMPMACFNTQTDAMHCGSCTTACPTGQVCTASVCAVSCTMGTTNCAGTCANLQTDLRHCGLCGNTCVSGTRCVNSVCNDPTCGGVGLPPCGDNGCRTGLTLCNGTCVDTLTNGANCGMCGAACPSGQVCSAGRCAVSCTMGTTNCAGTCVNLQTNISNCRVCGTVCPARNQAMIGCTAGVCGFTCNAGFGNCDGMDANGCEAALNTGAHCGACGTVCGAGTMCSSGACVSSCATGTTFCPTTMACFNLQTDASNCGGCGTACSTNHGAATCAAGTCRITCSAGYGNCDMNPANGCETVVNGTDAANCGGCGMACTAGQSCVAGACVLSCPSGQHVLGSACVADGGVRPIAPLSFGETTQLRPRLTFALPSGASGATLQLCRDRACMTVLQTLTVSSGATSADPSMDLPVNTAIFWRGRARFGSTDDTQTGPTWLFRTPPLGNRGTANSSARPHLDVNGDGFDDLAVAAPLQSNARGRVLVMLGRTAGPDTATPITLDGATDNDRLGASVSAAGDLDGDGYGDLLVGVPGSSTGTGAVRVYFGSATGLSTTPGATVTGASPGERFGATVTGAGDVNLDGYADFAVGAPSASSSVGRVAVYHGTARGMTAWTPVTGAAIASPAGASGEFGASLANGGDVNGDGVSDLLVGAPGYNGRQGRMYAFYGVSGMGLPTARSWESTGGSMGDRFAASVAGLGDVNADGFSDVAGSAPEALGAAGGLNVFLGTSGGISSAASVVPLGRVGGGRFSHSMAGTGDINGDGNDDMIVGAPNAGGTGGAVYILAGPGMTTTFFQQSGVGELIGISAAGVGDLNNDGNPDAAFGAPLSGGTGAVYLRLGAAMSMTSATRLALTVGAGASLGGAIAGHEALDSPARCSDGLVQLGEQCDDGNSTDGDGCESTCTLACGSAYTGVSRPLRATSFGGHCYLGFNDGIPWTTARDRCRASMGYLAVITSSAENDAARSASDRNVQAWIGLYDNMDGAPNAGTNATLFTWVDGTSTSAGYANFGAGEPNGNPGEDCVAYFESPFRPPGTTWNDAVCTLAYPYICEFNSL